MSSAPPGSGSPPVPGHNLLINGDFGSGTHAWWTSGVSASPVAGGHGDKTGVRVAVPVSGMGFLGQRTDAVATRGNPLVRARLWVRADRSGLAMTLRLRELAGDHVVADLEQPYRSFDTRWHLVQLAAAGRGPDASWGVSVQVDAAPAGSLTFDDALLAVDDASVAPARGLLSNGCAVSARGVPACSAYLGGAYGGNADPAAWERYLGRPLGVHRTFFRPGTEAAAQQVATEDLQHNRLPWISFRAPYSWAAMAAGRGDTWVRDLATSLARIDGPVWLALDAEPEGDGPIADWTAMQEHLAPIVRDLAPNVAFTVILTGYNQVRGPAKYHLGSLWPDVPIDVAGFDVYDRTGAVVDGVRITRTADLDEEFFRPLSAWATAHATPWAVGETGYTTRAAASDPHWVQATYQAVLERRGVAMSYFNSRVNSIADWSLSTPRKMADFKAALDLSPSLTSASSG